MKTGTNTDKDGMSLIVDGGNSYFKLSGSDSIRPFFMSIVSHSDHWMFVSSNGGISAGRKNPDYALFPYYTDDKITESAETTGSKSIFIVEREGSSYLWEPFSIRQEGLYRVTRNIYKSIYGNKIRFEEINHSLELSFSYEWNPGDLYGFIRKSKLVSHSNRDVNISLLDGIQNLMPCGVNSALQNNASNLVDAYKRSELDNATGLGIYALSAIIADKAEPSEALKANVAWSFGLEHPSYLLSSLQLNNFRRGLPVSQEEDVKAEKGAYFILDKITLPEGASKEWMIVANVNQNHSAIASLREQLKNKKELCKAVKLDIEEGNLRLIELIAAADGLQVTIDIRRDARHFSNVLFNSMRGGTFDFNYQIEKWDFASYLSKANRSVYERSGSALERLPGIFTLQQLEELAEKGGDPDLKRLCLEYLPLRFSRRHGDPSRPWNVFSINTRSEKDGSKILDYQGNWRDIFQNWEALAHSFPLFVESMMHKFLNATTFDGYNAYWVTKNGYEWETIEPDNPWSYIGYWGDHQVIYLLKFLEMMHDHYPGRLESCFDQELFVYANIPYRIKSYEDILRNPKDTIRFDHELNHEIMAEKETTGADGALLRDQYKNIYRVTFIEKILAMVLAKVSNFIPEGGIWMNTQRPEWNDANNALVGNGASMVTLCYLRRFLAFFQKLLTTSDIKSVRISSELSIFYHSVMQTLQDHQQLLVGKFSDEDRRRVLDGLGRAGSTYRDRIYQQSFGGRKQAISLEALKEFVELSLRYLEHSIKANRRSDGLYHAYNLITIENRQGVSISFLSEMLEGQVAALSSGFLTAEQALMLLDGMKNSRLCRQDQSSYLLYPYEELTGFLHKNNLSSALVSESPLLALLAKDGNRDIIEKDINGHYHFNGNFRNAGDLKNALRELAQTKYARLAEKEKTNVLQAFENVFNHKAFTGRSGTFFGYEGLGSIYWHMVSKLLLAVEECCLKAFNEGAEASVTNRLKDHFFEIFEGIGVHKTPQQYGAFPTDPYSHTPAGKGAQQPGMTGQVKEDILSRFGELGVFVKEGMIFFNPCLLRRQEFITETKVFEYVDVHLKHRQLQLEKGSLCFTYCQVPVVYRLMSESSLSVIAGNDLRRTFNTLTLDEDTSMKIFGRTGEIVQIEVHISESQLS